MLSDCIVVKRMREENMEKCDNMWVILRKSKTDGNESSLEKDVFDY